MDKLAPEQWIDQGISIKDSNSDSPSRFPRSICSASREEFVNPIELTIRDGKDNPVKLPEDLHGHFFVIGPCGSPQSPRLPENERVVWTNKDGWTPIYNGDGIIYRFSFNEKKASLKTSLVKPPCYYADKLTITDAYRELAFQNIGFPRISFNKLGNRNQLNTNLFPFKLTDDESDRLLVTWDVGRPYEIDPETLETLTPVGKNKDWADLLPEQQPQPFKQLMTSAHPVFDSATGELFTVNVGKSIWTILAFSRSLKSRLTETAKTIKYVIANPDLLPSIQTNFIKLYSIFLGIVRLVIGFLGLLEKVSKTSSGGIDYDFVHLLAWDGKKVGIKKKWNVVLPGKKPLTIDQTVHQVGLTESYIVFVETSFKFSLANVFAQQQDLFPKSVKMILSDFAEYPQYPISKLYIVKRADLEKTSV